ncbi:MAG TPA: hypothetical protein VNX26_11175 [Candidatus Acidoferrum sp.]|jgi:hypothetical protein|nr:hypothetical protein [Candidatus Acidoferrum sp.]
MNENKGLLSSGWSVVGRNKRYIVWFYVLNVLLGLFGTVAFVNQAGTILDHSLLADRLLHGFDLGVLTEMFVRPEFGPTMASRAPAIFFAVLFFFATALFLPGVLQGYASTYRLPREDFFRACGRNLWRFIRLLLVAGIVMIPLTVALFSLHGLLEDKAAGSTNELLLPGVRLLGLIVIFLVMAIVRIWFDLAQADVVLSDQRAVRRSIGRGFRHTWRNLGRLLGSYVATTIVAALVLVAGLWVWMRFVPPATIAGAFLVSQLTLLLLLIPRFWQRGVAVAYHQRYMVEPILVQSFTPGPVVVPGVAEPEPAPVGLSGPPETQAS